MKAILGLLVALLLFLGLAAQACGTMPVRRPFMDRISRIAGT
jgi:hypothetical protein